MPTIPHVLIADDEPAFAEYLALTVRALGFEADVALDGRSAVQRALARPPALMFLDALLPKADGFQVLREMREAQPGLPIVMMSGIYRKRAYKAEAVDALGARDYVLKPLSVVQIWEIVERHLGSARGNVGAEGFPGVPLCQRPLPRVVADLHGTRATGLLFVRATEGTAVLFFEDGQLIFGRGNDPATRLDRILKAKGLLSGADLRRAPALAAQANPGKRYGQMLVDSGLLTDEQLSEALAEQVRQHVARPFTWSEGASHFFAAEAPRQEPWKAPIEVTGLIAWGCRQLRDDEHLAAWLPRGRQRLRRTPLAGAILARVSLSDQERELVALMDGTRTVARIRAIGRMTQADVNRVLALVLCAGIVEAEPPSEPQRSAGSASMAAPSAGDLGRTPPATLLATMALAGATGVLQLERDEDGTAVKRTVYFEDGDVAFASSNHPDDRLGQVLVRAGLVVPADLAAALEASRERPGVAIGRLLVERQALPLDGLHDGLVAQVDNVLSGLMTWRDGSFLFREGPLPARDVVPLALGTLDALMRAVRACPFEALLRSLPPPETVLQATWNGAETARDLDLLPLERRVLDTLAEPRTLELLIAQLEEPPESVLRTVHAYLELGIAEGRHAATGEDRPKQAVTPAPAAMGIASADDEAFDPAEASLAGDPPPEPRAESPARAEPAPEPAWAAAAAPPAFAVDDDDEDFDGPEDGFKPAPAVEPRPSPLSLLDEGEFGSFDETVFAPAAAAAGSGEEQATVRAAAAPAATAVLEAEFEAALGSDLEAEFEAEFDDAPLAPLPAWTAEEKAAVEEFLSRLAFHLAVEPGTVPQSVLSALPATLRKRFGL